MLLFALVVACSRLAQTMMREAFSVSPGASDGGADLSQFCDSHMAAPACSFLIAEERALARVLKDGCRCSGGLHGSRRPLRGLLTMRDRAQ
ncbi:hypothetical protein XH79_05710 [Bradyrhizobium sp. CCBAU 45389]|nr:hypothetical protein [Bradyrhizobium sp. CCBAU 45389]